MTWLDKLFGTKPKIPEFKPIDAADSQRDAIADNRAVLPQAEQLANETNAASTRTILANLERTMPGFFGQAKENIGAQLRGEVPDDVSRFVQQVSAESGLNLGVGGGGLGRNLTGRDLGLTSMQIQQQGLLNFQGLSQPFLQSAMSPTSMFFSPSQRLAHSINERDNAFQVDLLRSQVKAAPDPGLRGLHDTAMEILGMVVSMYGGSAQYSGGPQQPDYTLSGPRSNQSTGGGTQSGGFGFGFQAQPVMQSGGGGDQVRMLDAGQGFNTQQFGGFA